MPGSLQLCTICAFTNLFTQKNPFSNSRHYIIYIYIRATPGVCPGGKPQAYQLSSTRVSTIINYQGINYHQLSGYQLSSTIRVSTIINYQSINYHQLSEYQLSSTIRVYQLSSTRASTIINYQGINYHQLSGYQLYIYHQLSGYINYHQPGYQLSSTIRASTIINYQLSGYQLSSNTTLFLSKFSPPPLLATNAFKDLQIQHSFYQNFPPPPPFGNQCIQ